MDKQNQTRKAHTFYFCPMDQFFKTFAYHFRKGRMHCLQDVQDKAMGKPFKDRSSKCLKYYFYFIDEVLGLWYLRVPTWLPFKLQIYRNGHSLLSS